MQHKPNIFCLLNIPLKFLSALHCLKLFCLFAIVFISFVPFASFAVATLTANCTRICYSPVELLSFSFDCIFFAFALIAIDTNASLRLCSTHICRMLVKSISYCCWCCCCYCFVLIENAARSNRPIRFKWPRLIWLPQSERGLRAHCAITFNLQTTCRKNWQNDKEREKRHRKMGSARHFPGAVTSCRRRCRQSTSVRSISSQLVSLDCEGNEATTRQ